MTSRYALSARKAASVSSRQPSMTTLPKHRSPPENIWVGSKQPKKGYHECIHPRNQQPACKKEVRRSARRAPLPPSVFRPAGRLSSPWILRYEGSNNGHGHPGGHAQCRPNRIVTSSTAPAAVQVGNTLSVLGIISLAKTTKRRSTRHDPGRLRRFQRAGSHGRSGSRAGG